MKFWLVALVFVSSLAQAKISEREIDAQVARLMERGSVPGLALALIENGQPTYVKAYGYRRAAEKLPLENTTVMYGASLTKFVFAYAMMQLTQEKKLELDRPLAAYLPKPLPQYEKYAELKDDARWEKLTARNVLDHTTGFPNFRFVNADGKLDFKFEPGVRYAYSGEGMNLLQFVLEEGLKLDLGQEMQRRVFDRFGMKRTSMVWREDFQSNMADGYAIDGKAEGHHARQSVRAAGSMDTTIEDAAKFVAAFLRGEGISPEERAEMLRPQIEIRWAHQFPTLETAKDETLGEVKLAAGLGVVLCDGPQGKVFFKGGHDDWTDNMIVALPDKKTALVLLSNSSRAEAIYPALVKAILGETGLPWRWEYVYPPELKEISPNE